MSAPRPFQLTPEIAVTSAWSLAAALAERELAPAGGFAALGPAHTRLLRDEIAQAGLPLLAALVAASPHCASASPALADDSPSPWHDRFLAIETACRTAISLDVERLWGEAPLEPLVAAARARGLEPLAGLLSERLAGADLDRPQLDWPG